MTASPNDVALRASRLAGRFYSLASTRTSPAEAEALRARAERMEELAELARLRAFLDWAADSRNPRAQHLRPRPHRAAERHQRSRAATPSVKASAPAARPLTTLTPASVSKAASSR